MDQTREDLAGVKSIAAFRTYLGLIKTSLNNPQGQTEKGSRFKQKEVEFEITNLPLPVKKHIIAIGIVQGKIFMYSDVFACIKQQTDITQTHAVGVKPLILYLRGPSHQSLILAIETVEILLIEVIEGSSNIDKRAVPNKSWALNQTEYEVSHLSRACLSHVISKGVIQGQINQNSGAVVSARGSPNIELLNISAQQPFTERPLYLVIQGPKQALTWAREQIDKLINEVNVAKIPSPGSATEPRLYETTNLSLQPQRDNSQSAVVLPDNTQETPLSEVIQQLQKIIQSSETTGVPFHQNNCDQSLVVQSTAVVPSSSQPPLGITPQPQLSAGDKQETHLTDVILQLQQFIQTSTENSGSKSDEKTAASTQQRSDTSQQMVTEKRSLQTKRFNQPVQNTIINISRLEKSGHPEIRIATFNVQGCSDSIKRDEVDEIFHQLGISIAVLQETNLPSGHTNTRYYSWWCASDPNSSDRGVAILLHSQSKAVLRDFIPHSCSLATAIVIFNKARFGIIGCYLPPPTHNQYPQIAASIIQALNDKATDAQTILLGDFNAQVGSSDVTSFEKNYFGNQLVHKTSDINGTFLKGLVPLFDLFAVSTDINHSEVNKESSSSTNEWQSSQGDFIFVERNPQRRHKLFIETYPSSQRAIVITQLDVC